MNPWDTSEASSRAGSRGPSSKAPTPRQTAQRPVAKKKKNPWDTSSDEDDNAGGALSASNFRNTANIMPRQSSRRSAPKVNYGEADSDDDMADD